MPVSRHLERLQGVVNCGQHPDWFGVRYLHVKHRLAIAEFCHGLLNERRLADAASSRDFGKEPAFAVEHSFEVRKLRASSVELPVSHAVHVR